MGSSIISGPSTGLQWTYIKTVTTTNANTLNTGALPVYAEYLLHGTFENMSVGLTGVMVNFNGDVGANYAYTIMSSTGVGTVSGATSAAAFNLNTTTKCNLDLNLTGKTQAVASGTLGAYILAGHTHQALSSILWTGGNATQITSVLFTANGGRTMSGRIEVYGRNPL